MTESFPFQTLQNTGDKTALLLAFHCAPLLKGSKAANLVTVSSIEALQIAGALSGTGILHFCFKLREDKVLLYLYRPKELALYLSDVRIQTFLRQFGYVSFVLPDLLARLSERVALFSRGEISFPHEIGVFLEYPLEDVLGFLENEGRNFLYAGYWKVYHNAKAAAETFQQYDKERESALRAVMAGKSIAEIVS